MQQSYRFLAPKWFVTCLVVLLATPAAAQTPPQRIFQQPEQAAQALVKAAGENDQEALLDILGREHEELIVTPDLAAAAVRALHGEDASHTGSVGQDREM